MQVGERGVMVQEALPGRTGLEKIGRDRGGRVQ
jgi:hypothetical protein